MSADNKTLGAVVEAVREYRLGGLSWKDAAAKIAKLTGWSTEDGLKVMQKTARSDNNLYELCGLKTKADARQFLGLVKKHVVVRLNSEGGDDGKLYRVPAGVWEKIRAAGVDREEWPDEINTLLDRHFVEKNEVSVDGELCTVGDAYGCWEGEEQLWGR